MFDNIIGFDLDWRINDIDDEGFTLIRMAQRSGYIEELCPSERVWHYRAINEKGRIASSLLAKRYNAIRLATTDDA